MLVIIPATASKAPARRIFLDIPNTCFAQCLFRQSGQEITGKSAGAPTLLDMGTFTGLQRSGGRRVFSTEKQGIFRMRSGTAFLIAIAALTILAAPAGAAGRLPGDGGLMVRPNPEIERQSRMAAEPERSPYARTYSEQIAQSLGLRDGGISLYESRQSARNPYAPSVSLGGTMIRLRWRQ